MSDTYKQLKDELSVQYPEFTDNELERMVDKLIDFFMRSAKAIYEDNKDTENPN